MMKAKRVFGEFFVMFEKKKKKYLNRLKKVERERKLNYWKIEEGNFNSWLMMVVTRG